MTTILDRCAVCERSRPSATLPRSWTVLDAIDRVLVCPDCWDRCLRRSPMLVQFDQVLRDR